MALSVLPAAARSSGISMPWSTAFLTICIRGSPRISTTDLSDSVSAPTNTRSTFLPRVWFISLTTRLILENAVCTGTIRMDITTSWSSSVSFFSSRADFWNRSRPELISLRSGLEVTPDSVITISATRSRSLSSFSSLTEIMLPLPWAPPAAGASFFWAALGASAAGLASASASGFAASSLSAVRTFTPSLSIARASSACSVFISTRKPFLAISSSALSFSRSSGTVFTIWP